MNELKTAPASPVRSNLMISENAICGRCQARVQVEYRRSFTATARCAACGTTLVYELGASYTA
jgi:ribosomal protein S27E